MGNPFRTTDCYTAREVIDGDIIGQRISIDAFRRLLPAHRPAAKSPCVTTPCLEESLPLQGS